MTVDQITKEVSRAKPVSKRQVFRYLSELEIKPEGPFQRPRHYPPDAADRIIKYLRLPILTLPQLRVARRKAQKARAK